MSNAPPLIPELDVADLDRSLAVYTAVLGFRCHVTRPEERFAYLIRDNVHLMLEEADGPGRRFQTAPLEHPFGRGMNLQIEVADVDALWASVQRSELSVVIPLEERWYRQGETEAGNRQFVVADPDGYLLRFFSSLGRRPAKGAPPESSAGVSREPGARASGSP
jgi:catechol 2,3-dioxygenase-like lactoylglutathione lyase family enzyme